MLKPLTTLVLIALTGLAQAGPVTLPNTLSNNTSANADDVQENFDALVTQSNENDARITGIEQNLVVETDNTAIGDQAFSSNTTGRFNTASGYQALLSNTAGNENVASGAFALRDNIGGSQNIAYGNQALLSNTNGTFNAASGFRALESNTTGNQNTGSGALVLYSNITGDDNTASGYRALYANTLGYSNTANGALSLESNTTGNFNAASGFQALQSITTGSGNTGCGALTLFSNTTGNNNTAIGFGADVSSGVSNATAIGANAIAPLSNMVMIGGPAVQFIAVTVAPVITSDARLKESIHSLDNGLALINDLNPVSYHRINNVSDDVEMGLLAQEVAKTLDKHGLKNSGMVHQATPDSYMSVRYNDLLAPMIRAIQELDDAGDKKDAQITSLQEQLNSQQQEMLALLQAQQEQIARLEGIVVAEQVAAR